MTYSICVFLDWFFPLNYHCCWQNNYFTGSVESANIEEYSSIIIHDFSESTTEDDIKEHFNDKEVSGEENISSIQINKEEGWCVVKFPKNQGKKIYSKCLLFGLYFALLIFIVLQFSTEKQATGPGL